MYTRMEMNIKRLVKKLQKGFSFLDPAMVPEDVKEGHFVVYAVKGEERQRFVVELGFLKNPAFLKLLEQAEKEYGFEQKEALNVPCRPQELQRILDQDRCV